MKKRVKPEGDFRFVFIDLRCRFIATWIILMLTGTFVIVKALWGDLCANGNGDLGAVMFIAIVVFLLTGAITSFIYERKRRLIKKEWCITHPRCMKLSISRERVDRRQDLIDDISGYISQERDPHVMRSVSFYYIYLKEK